MYSDPNNSEFVWYCSGCTCQHGGGSDLMERCAVHEHELDTSTELDIDALEVSLPPIRCESRVFN